ncbi:nitrilase-related carbon-nitrogen hydrolase [Streptomyces hoynatensis]|uniref:Carbon-nitrogen family hydrolase n=1 Tax=Streptomyces hoynatensis TaxID=1141874 RepID=A0A3A9YKL9_9ACTN|nr:nitrilase-related carbon-nitrogen hydrolase [Streptomyces hoynatensis]RKN37021.1 carbon-nitrogen family hydrolase [Streptomyces hoynatensis]
MRIALVQVASPPEEPPAARRERVGRMVAGARGADLVVLPELWAAGYFAFDSYAERAESLAEGPTVTAARAWARELGAHVHLGSLVERDPRGDLFNTAALIAPDGALVHAYRKIHVFGHASREAELLTPGRELTVADTRFGRLGATTCYDLRFPELWRGLVDLGATTVVVPAAWPAARRAHWRLFTSCRAVEEQVLLIACNAVGTQDGGVELGGHSRVVDAWGTVLAEAGTEEGVTFCEADPGAVARVRAEFPVLADRRRLPAGSTAGTPTEEER